MEVCGPETHATLGKFSAGSDVYGINFRAGVFMPHLPPGSLLDTRIPLVNACQKAFWLHYFALPIPKMEDAEAFAEQLARAGLLVYDPVVMASLRGEPLQVSTRSLQYRYLKSTGMSQKTVRQIERVKSAALMLEQGTAIADVVYLQGYFDQAHLTRSLRRFYGQLPMAVAQVTASTRSA